MATATARTVINTMTEEQKARMAPFAREWVEWALETGPADRARVEDGMRRCYELSGLRWHGNVVWVSSPFVGALSAPIAAAVLKNSVGDTVRGTVDGTVGDTVGDTVGGTVHGTVDDTVGGTVDGTVGGTVGDTVDDTVGDTVRGTVGGTVGGTVRGTVGDTVRDTVRGTVRGTVGDTVGDTVRGTVRGTVGGTVDGTVGGTVRGTVRGTVGDTVRDDAALIGEYRDEISRGWYSYLTGWWSWWQAGNAFCIRELGACPDMAERVDAWQDACSAGWWWPHSDYVIVAERPVEIHQERVGPDGWGSHRMHNADGPAISWADGWSIHCWHGQVVPAWVVERPTLALIQKETNTEVRRCAIESYGWDRYLADLGVSPVDECDDPGNPGRRLALFDLPPSAQVYPEPVRLLVMSNGSLDRGGARRTFAETVPMRFPTEPGVPLPVCASAWQFGVNPSAYARLRRRT